MVAPHIRMLTSLLSALATLRSEYAMKPAPTPFVIEYVRGMTKGVRSTATPVAKSMFPTLLRSRIGLNMNQPTSINTPAVACGGTMPARGARKMDTRNSAAVTRLASPVLAPSATPAPDSMYVVLLDVPKMPPNSAPRESTQKTRSARSIVPSFLSQPPCDATDTTVPAVSKKSESMSEKTVRIATKKPSLNTSKSPMPFAPLVNTAPIVEKSGVSTSVLGMTATPGSAPYVAPPVAALTRTPSTVAPMIPRISAPLMLREYRNVVSSSPPMVTIAVPLLRLPSATASAALPVPMARPPLQNPIAKINAPLPAPMPGLCGTGTASSKVRRTPSAIAMQIARPSSATTPIAPCHERPAPLTRPNATTALMPRPAAPAYG